MLPSAGQAWYLDRLLVSLSGPKMAVLRRADTSDPGALHALAHSNRGKHLTVRSPSSAGGLLLHRTAETRSPIANHCDA